MSKFHLALGTLAIATLVSVGQAQAQQATPGTQDQFNQQQTQPARSQINQGERFEARRQPLNSQGQNVTVKEAIVQKLQKANEAEIELAKMAMNKTDNEQLKELTRMLVEDHQQCNQKLQQLSSQQQQQTSTAQGKTVPQELLKIGEKACDNSLKMTKDMLSEYDGQDFQMAFLGQQCVAHIMMLAELKAIESEGPQELQSLASETISKIEKHLEKTKELAKKLEDDRKND